jgi:outer membrane protein assembly factor BamB
VGEHGLPAMDTCASNPSRASPPWRSKGGFSVKQFLYLAGCATLGACGGGGGSDVPSTPSVPPLATLNVTLKPSATTQTVSDVDSAANFTVDASYTGSTSRAVVPQFTYDKAVLALDGDVVQSGTTYSAKFKTVGDLPAKSYANTISFRLCPDSGCATVYPGSTQSFVHTLDVKIADWTTRQRNPEHDGFVHMGIDPTKIVKSWDFAPAAATGFDESAARQGTVFLTQRSTDGSSVALALDGATGAERWRYSLGNVSDASGPALSGNQVLFSTMFTSSGNNPLVMLNADTGQFTRNLTFAAQWSTFAQPTPYADSVYIAAGYYGGVVYGYDVKNGVAQWETFGSAGNTWDGEAPAADSRYIYYYSGSLDVIDRLTGKLIKSIDDPFWQWNGYSYGGTPMIGSDNHVIAYSGNGMGTYTISFPLVDYDVTAGSYRWRTASGYSVVPAVAKGVIYAASNQTAEFDAIDEKTGKVLWAWPRPAGEQFVGNVVVTDTLAFVSTDVSTYAIALDGAHETKWSAKTPGALAITPDAKLIVSQIQGSSPAKVTAYALR